MVEGQMRIGRPNSQKDGRVDRNGSCGCQKYGNQYLVVWDGRGWSPAVLHGMMENRIIIMFLTLLNLVQQLY